eukprot:2937084-Prymnesium_polylepis.1
MDAWSCCGSSTVSRVVPVPLVVARHRAPKMPKNSRWFACVASPVRGNLSKSKTRVSSFGPDQEQDPRDVKRVAGAYNRLSDLRALAATYT